MSAHIIGSSTSFIENSLVDEYYPIQAPLSAKYKRTFAYKTIGFRLPVILTKIIDQLSQDKNEVGERYGTEARAEIKDIVGRLAKLKNELQTNKRIVPVDNPLWNGYISQIVSRYHKNAEADVTYYLSPWLFVECYIYQRIYEAFHSTVHLQKFDYVQKQKQGSFLESLEKSAVLGEYTLSLKSSSPESLQSLLEVALWGNQCDLSLSAGASNSQAGHLVDKIHALKESILCDNSEEVWKTLLELPRESRRSIGYILDNAGFELFTDFCFADLLLNEVDRIDFYVKDMPWFISDAMTQDIEWMLDSMGSSDKKILRQLAQKWKDNIQTDRWRILTYSFWTLPHTFNEMEGADPNLYSVLSTHELLIFKGDLNYRKLVGDINWDPTTPFKEALRGFLPAPLVSLRTCKADTVVGLKPGLGEEMNAKDPNWLTTGEYGLVQFAK